MTPSVEPVTAIQTTETAEGTRVRKSAKCNLASKKPDDATHAQNERSAAHKSKEEDMSLESRFPPEADQTRSFF
jgi:hypothetical protein